MAGVYTAEETVDMLGSSDESEDPEFRLPHQSDFEHEEPHEGNSTTFEPTFQSGGVGESDYLNEEDIAQGNIVQY